MDDFATDLASLARLHLPARTGQDTMVNTGYRLLAPLAGGVVPLDQVPDPMFALGMMGDGVAIEPSSGDVHAPCAGQVIHVHKRGHAVKLKTADGAEILIHVGLEAVALNGDGFLVKVVEGQQVSDGDLLLRFDPDRLRASCGAITTPVLVTNDGTFRILERLAEGPVGVGDGLMTIVPAAAVAGGARDNASTRAERTVILGMVQGLHARPAALLAARARDFQSAIEIALDQRRANAKSPVALLTLGSRHGSHLTIVAEGGDCRAAVDALADALDSGLGDPVLPVAGASKPKLAVTALAGAAAALGAPASLSGVAAAPGLAIGVAVRLTSQCPAPKEEGRGIETERDALSRAIATTRRHLECQAAAGRTEQQREIMQAHAALVDDPDLLETAQGLIRQGKSAGFAWSRSVAQQADALRALDNPRLAERAVDLLDLERQVLTILAGGSLESTLLPEQAIVVADDLLPSQFMAFGNRLPLGILVAKGGRTSHVAILAASSGVPMLAAAGPQALAIADGTPLILDADQALVLVDPAPQVIAETRRAAAAREDRRERNLAAAHQDCVMADGTRLPVYANLGSVADAERGMAFGAEGSGLLRTEFLFLERRSAPTEEEQWAEYQAAAKALSGQPLVIRTLDVGGDKPIAYLAQEPEENPILGVRGVRVCKRHPELLRQQFRAILKVSPAGQCRIMLPMIADVAELRWARRLLEEEKATLGVTEAVPLGIMIEVPAAVALADRLAVEADFFSIGTNDLTQYVLAMDRGNSQLAADIDAFHPAVLRMIAQTVAGARRHDRPVGVCGSMASEVLAAPILIGLGVSSLSATRSSIPELKAFIRTLDMAGCRDVACRALDLDSAAEVRALVRDCYPGL